MVWTVIAQIAVYVVAAVISYNLRSKPDGPRPAALSDFEIPTASESRPIPVVFGTVRITGANIVWYGDFRSKAVKKKGGKK